MIKVTLFSLRMTYFLGFVIASLCVGVPIYLQMHYGINPCPLCILQRITLACLGVFFFFGCVFHFKKIGLKMLGLAATAFAALGILLAGRQTWLQLFPPNQHTDCGASLQYMLQVLPLTEVLKKVFIGGTECSQVDMKILNLSLAEWSLIAFVFFFLFSCWQLYRAKQ